VSLLQLLFEVEECSFTRAAALLQHFAPVWASPCPSKKGIGPCCLAARTDDAGPHKLLAWLSCCPLLITCPLYYTHKLACLVGP
jgi:hypothetical protein